jgi:4-hydroxy-3-polyprenylbenzoate decarboxylase
MPGPALAGSNDTPERAPMAYKDLQDFLRLLEKKGELRRIKAALDPYLEIAEVTDRASKAVGPALLFENPKGSRFPVATNVFGSFPRMHLSLECADLDALGRRIDDILEMEKPEGLIEKLKLLPKLAKMAGIFPKTVARGCCQDVVATGSDVDLSIMPVLTTWPGDAGPFITLPVVVTRDPVSGKRNVGMYRMQVFDKNTTGMHWHRHKGGAYHYHLAEKRGERLPVAVAIGPDPACTYAATAPLPDDIDEFLFAGFLRQSPVELIQCKTVDLQVPANSQFVLEGYVEPGERRREGPFGDHTGYYSLADDYPVFHVTALTHRADAVYPATLVGPPPMEDCYMGKATERLFLPLIKKQLPEIVDLSLPLEGVFHNFCFVSIDKRYPGQTRKIMYAIWGLGQMMFTKVIVVVDAGVNVQNTSEVLWRLGNNVDPKRDIVIVEGPLDALDHASPTPLYGGKIGIDATKKGPEEGHRREWPDSLVMDATVKTRIDALWGELGL